MKSAAQTKKMWVKVMFLQKKHYSFTHDGHDRNILKYFEGIRTLWNTSLTAVSALASVCYLSVCCSRTPSLAQMILGGGKPSARQSMVSDRVALVTKALFPMLMLILLWNVNGRICCCLMIAGPFAAVSNDKWSDQLGSLSVWQITYKHNIKNKSVTLTTKTGCFYLCSTQHPYFFGIRIVL